MTDTPTRLDETRPGWISLPGHLLEEPGVILLREPADKNRQLLAHQLREGLYPHPFVVDDGVVRRLHFDLKLIQSEMEIARPDQLRVAYTRSMMGFLLFNPLPKHVVVAGLGGGSLTKYCYRHLGRCRVTTLESSAGVIACREWFMLPADDERMAVHWVEASAYFAVAPAAAVRADAILLDAYDEHGLAPEMCRLAFYDSVKRHLKPRGIAVANISGHGNVAETHMSLLDDAFDGRTVTIEVPDDGNRIVFAFNDPDFPPVWQRLTNAARELEARHPFDFARLLREIERSARRRRRRGI
ncbi:MAG: hypothetical protein RJA63_1955 [Pseudomonadota bacterium]|jgi:spermidine synthase